MTIEDNRAIARKMSKLRMFDIANSMHGAGAAMLKELGGYSPSAAAWLEAACDEWAQYVAQIKQEVGIDVEG